jgi:hypothetical protein
MDIHKIKITQKEIDRIVAQASPAQPSAFAGDACAAYGEARPFLQTGIAILNFVYPPAASAIAAAMVILDKACENVPTR